MTVTVMANNGSNDKNCKTDNKYIQVQYIHIV